jgi:hypothetical protein
MLTSKKMTLKPLIESTEGLHLTAYLVNKGDLSDIKAQLREVVNQAYESLTPVTSTEERNRFLEPLDNLLVDSSILRKMKGNIGIFRSKAIFRVLNVPVEVEATCHIATSFHVKPLLKWLQADQEFLLLGFEKDAAHLYLGSQSSFKLVDSILFPEVFKEKELLDVYLSLKKIRQLKVKEVETFTWLNDWINQLTQNTKPKLFMAGEETLVKSMGRYLNYKNVIKAAVAPSFGKHNMFDVCASIRKILKSDSKNSIEQVLAEFRFAEEGHRTRKNIFQIARAVVQGRVRKLIVSDELSIFGKIDKKTGGIAIHPFDLDHEDDDILDDLAQMVLSQGGEVVVASKSEIPKGRPILAILDDDGKTLDKKEDLPFHKIFQERVG